MTAEIAVMNQEAVALAADSAVSGPKVFTSANKIFALSKYCPVAIMVFDSAKFLDVPWETIIKTYRSRLGEQSFSTLQEHAAHFLEFFNEPNPLFPEESQSECAAFHLWSYFRRLPQELDEVLRQSEELGVELTDDFIAQRAADLVAAEHEHWTEASPIPSLDAGHADAVRSAYAEEIERALEEGCESIPLGEEQRQQLREIAGALMSADLGNGFSPWSSGVVIAGFGRDEYFPQLLAFEFEIIALNRLKYFQTYSSGVSPSNSAVIRAFAQSEQVGTFMEGIDSNVRDATLAYWRELLPDFATELAGSAGLDDQAAVDLSASLEERYDEIVGEFSEQLWAWQHDMYVKPIIRVVGMMPKDELAAMAESLVNLTSFKRKVSEAEETVGGPIDVAVISKGDGLVWIKRKHYFPRELNPQFFANYYREPRS